MILQGTRAAIVSELRAGQWAALFADCDALQHIRHADPVGHGCVRVEWDHGPRTKVTVRIMPGSNRVQIAADP